MSGFFNLTSADFFMGKGKSGNLMFNNIRGYSVVLFYANTCDYCKPYLHIFKSLPGLIGNCSFGIVNIPMNKDIIQLSRQTISPIKYVPLIIYYIDGRPFMIYNGEPDVGQLKQFIIDVTKQLSLTQKTKFYEENIQKQEQEKEIPKYTIGKPKETSIKIYGDMICEGDVCYISEADDIKNAKYRR